MQILILLVSVSLPLPDTGQVLRGVRSDTKKREPGEIPQKENPVRFHSTWLKIAMLAAEDAVAEMTAVAEAVEDMAGPHLVQYHVSHQKLGHERT